MTKEKEMKRIHTSGVVAIMICSALLLAACGTVSDSSNEIPLTTSSDKALEYFLNGRDLLEKLRAQESRQYFQYAVNEDPDFAMAHLYLAQAAPSAKAFFESMDKTLALLDKVSSGEKLWIQGFEAAAIKGDPLSARKMFQQLVEAHPDDERARNLLAGNYFGQQEYDLAVIEYNKVTAINPEFSQAYNQLGYAYRFLERYDEAEAAFRKYIELIPDDPNPYDSYAELLMKIGRFDESIENYKAALRINPTFVFSHMGISSNLNFKGEHEAAREQLQVMYDVAKDDGQRRTALTATAISFVDEGKYDEALQQLEKQYAIAEAIHDTSNMSADLILMGNIMLEADRADDALTVYQEAVKIVGASSLSEDVKDQTKLANFFNEGRAFLAKGDIEQAKDCAAKYSERVEAVQNLFQIKFSCQLTGMIALETGNFDAAIADLLHANLLDPYNLYRLARAYEGKGDNDKAKEFYSKAADFNVVNTITYAYIRTKAQAKTAAL